MAAAARRAGPPAAATAAAVGGRCYAAGAPRPTAASPRVEYTLYHCRFSADSVSGIPYGQVGVGPAVGAVEQLTPAGHRLTQPRDFSSRWRGGGCKRGGRRDMKGGTWLHFRPAIRLRCWILGAWPGPGLPPQDPVSQTQNQPDDASHHPADSSIMMHHQAIPSLPAGGPPFEGPVLGTARPAVAQHLFSPARALPRGARPDRADTVQPLPPTRLAATMISA